MPRKVLSPHLPEKLSPRRPSRPPPVPRRPLSFHQHPLSSRRDYLVTKPRCGHRRRAPRGPLIIAGQPLQRPRRARCIEACSFKMSTQPLFWTNGLLGTSRRPSVVPGWPQPPSASPSSPRPRAARGQRASFGDRLRKNDGHGDRDEHRADAHRVDERQARRGRPTVLERRRGRAAGSRRRSSQAPGRQGDAEPGGADSPRASLTQACPACAISRRSTEPRDREGEAHQGHAGTDPARARSARWRRGPGTVRRGSVMRHT